MYSSRSLVPALALAAACAAALAPSVRAISMRDDVPNVNSTTTSNPYVALGAGSAFNALGFMTFVDRATNAPYTATGMLVNTTTPGVFKFLTAAHNVDSSGGAAADTPNGVADSDQYQLYFGANTSADGSTATGHVTVPASGVSIMPQWVSGNGTLGPSSGQFDLAVITFNIGMLVSGAVPTQRLGFSLTSPAGKTGTMVGYGAYGLGTNFSTNKHLPDGVRRAGNNTIDFVANDPGDANNNAFGFTVQTDFDSPSGNTSTIGSSVALTLEATTAGGDSGGPLLVQDGTGQYLIAGVLNGGRNNPTYKQSEYGDRSVWASTLDSTNLAYLQAQGIAVPEPSTYALLALGAGLLCVVCIHRKAAAVT